jgi:hypothetical protein
MDVEWIIVADAAEVINNKLYLMGGGWDVLMLNRAFPTQQQVAVAVSVRVPWNETNQRRQIQIDFTDEDGRSLGKIDGQFEVGRPAGIPQGQPQRFQMAITVPLGFEKPGGHAIVASIDGEVRARTSFSVVEGPHSASPTPSQGGRDG